MATRGPKPKPTEQAKRQGVRPSRVPNPPLRTSPEPKLTMPGDFTPYQEKAWEELVEVLTSLDVLDSADAATVETCAAMIGRMREARRLLNSDDLVVESQRGGLRSSPYWTIEREAGLQVARLLAELGLSPSARARLANAGAKSKKPEELLDDILGAPGRLQLVGRSDVV